MRLDIESLRAFYLIVEKGGMTRVADMLCLSQSAVSHKIKRLENRIGHTLFIRSDGQLNLTKEGKHLFSYAKKILMLHDEAVSSLSASDVVGEVKLGATEDIALSGLTSFLQDFSNQHPKTKLQVKVEQSLIVQEWLHQGVIDVGLFQIIEQDILDTDLLLWKDDLVWMSVIDRDWESLDEISLITFGSNCLYLNHMVSALQGKGFVFNHLLNCPTHSGVFSAVLSGLGVSAINRSSMPMNVIEISSKQLGALPRIAYVARVAQNISNEAIDTLLSSLPTLIKQR